MGCSHGYMHACTLALGLDTLHTLEDIHLQGQQEVEGSGLQLNGI